MIIPKAIKLKNGDWYETYFRDAYLIIAKMQRRYGVENRLK